MGGTDERLPRVLDLLETGGKPISLEERDRRLLQHRDFVRDLSNNEIKGFRSREEALKYFTGDVRDQVDARCDYFEEEIPKRAIECLSEDNEIAWRGYTRLLGMLMEVCDLHAFHHARAALQRIDQAFDDALYGVQNDLFRVEHDAKDIKKGTAYQTIIGTACALIYAMDREKVASTKKEAADRVANLLSKEGVRWPIRETGHSEKKHGERLYGTLMKIQRGNASELAIKCFRKRVNRSTEDLRYLLKCDLSHFGFSKMWPHKLS